MESLKKEEKKALLSSASWGLLQIKNVVYYDEVFIALTKLDDVFDRYELFALVLEQLNLETEWLLQVAPKKSLLGMFKETINSKHADWREKRKDYLKIIEEGNINKISELISEKLTGLKEENIEKNIISQLDKALKTQVRWNLLHVMSIVWLCDNVEN